MVVAILVFRSKPPEPFLQLPPPFKPGTTLRDWVTQWVPMKPGWGWIWKLENAVFGKRKPIKIFSEIVSLADSSPAGLAGLGFSEPNYSNVNGLAVWVLDDEEIKQVKARFKATPGITRVSGGRITTADGVCARLFSGESLVSGGLTNQVGLDFACVAWGRTGRTDLRAGITFTEPVTNVAASVRDAEPSVTIRTNLDLVFRVQLPKGKGMLLMNRPVELPKAPRFGIVIEPP